MKDIISRVTEEINSLRFRDAWRKGVLEYAKELWDSLQEQITEGYFNPEDLYAPKIIKRALLNGAGDWHEYSWGGFIPDLRQRNRGTALHQDRAAENGWRTEAPEQSGRMA